MNDVKKILIIDDDPRNIFALRAVLRSRGYPVLAAENMRDGLAALKREEGIAAILLDMMMPGIDGYEGIGMIRNETSWNAIPVVAVTAQAMVGDREKCLEAGADDYISKPVDLDQLMYVLQKLGV